MATMFTFEQARALVAVQTRHLAGILQTIDHTTAESTERFHVHDRWCRRWIFGMGISGGQLVASDLFVMRAIAMLAFAYCLWQFCERLISRSGARDTVTRVTEVRSDVVRELAHLHATELVLSQNKKEGGPYRCSN